VPLSPERKFHDAFFKVVRSEQPRLIVFGYVVDLKAAASDEAPCFAVRRNQSRADGGI
jgi:hypothetical protein